MTTAGFAPDRCTFLRLLAITANTANAEPATATPADAHVEHTRIPLTLDPIGCELSGVRCRV